MAGTQARFVVVTDGAAGAHVFHARAARISRPGRKVAGGAMPQPGTTWMVTRA
ncbi:hypothetical protein [Streptomyces sp. Root1310]|uniref:hypothetical protein n=1 Tax=Streptomyces sp. Root1310 TaxID=1736452 RepID=UPI0012FEB5F3|nr:hypothetical protein [Streptomyces sp. Root1310]